MDTSQIVLPNNRDQKGWGSGPAPPTNIEIAKLQQDAIKEAAKEHTKEFARNRQKFNDLVYHSKNVLYKLKTVFPFDFFPSTITIDQEKVTIEFKEFFSAQEIRSIYIKNIGQLYVDCGPFFATICMLDQVILDERSLIKIPYLKKGEAMKARRIIQGLLVAHKENVDVSRLADDNLSAKLESLGTMR